MISITKKKNNEYLVRVNTDLVNERFLLDIIIKGLSSININRFSACASYKENHRTNFLNLGEVSGKNIAEAYASAIKLADERLGDKLIEVRINPYYED